VLPCLSRQAAATPPRFPLAQLGPALVPARARSKPARPARRGPSEPVQPPTSCSVGTPPESGASPSLASVRATTTSCALFSRGRASPCVLQPPLPHTSPLRRQPLRAAVDRHGGPPLSVAERRCSCSIRRGLHPMDQKDGRRSFAWRSHTHSTVGIGHPELHQAEHATACSSISSEIRSLPFISNDCEHTHEISLISSLRFVFHPSP
jgi:hypothetical protein